MPAWRNRLHPNEVVLVAAYVATLRGKNLPSPRPPEGEIIPPGPSCRRRSAVVRGRGRWSAINRLAAARVRYVGNAPRILIRGIAQPPNP